MAALLLLAAWASGAAALVAETLWVRTLGRGVGTSAEALAVVVAAFLGGLGLGAAIASRIAPRSKAPLRAAAACEGAAALFVFLSPYAASWVPDAHLGVLRLLGLAPGPSAWPAALVALPVLVVPTAFLGATLPFLVRCRVRDVRRAGRWTGTVYAVNTLGAAVGCAVAGTVLLPTFGESGALRLAAAGNALAALLLLLADRPVSPGEAPAPAQPPPAPSGPAPWTPLVALFGSGLAALAAEVAFFRLLEPITGIHVHGLAVLLAAVLAGTALGSAVGARAAGRVRRPDLALCVAIAAGGALSVVAVLVCGAVPWVAAANGTAAAAAAKAGGGAALAASEQAVLATRLAGAALAVIPPLAAFAAAYPLAVRARARTAPEAAGAAGAVYAWNAAGNVVGSLLAGFVLLPRLGSTVTLAVVGAGSLALAAALWLAAPRPRLALGAAWLAAPLGLLAMPGALARLEDEAPRLAEVVALNKWHHGYRIESRRDYAYLSEILGGTWPRPPGHPEAPPLRPIEGTTSTVGLLEERGVVRLRQGGLSESKFASDPDVGSETEVALGLIAWLAHPSPRTALVIGHGAGWTVETLLATPLERVDVAEIEPAVLDMVERYRGPLEVRRAPNARLHLTDGRLLLRAAAKEGGTYDLVVSQPSHPWVPGAGHLFTRDAYALARRALRPDGVFAQWLNLFYMDLDLFRTALQSFAEVFPDAWLLHFPDELVLVGFTAAPRIEADRWERALASAPAGPWARAAGIDGPPDLLRRMSADGAGLRRIVGDGVPPSTDDDPRLEIGLASALFSGGDRARRERDAVLRLLHRGFPPDFAAAMPQAAERERWLARTAARAAEAGGDEARRWSREVPFDGGALARRARAKERVDGAPAAGEERQRMLDDAVSLLAEAVRLDPSDAEAARAWLEALRLAGRPEEAAARGPELAAAHPEDGPLLTEWARGATIAGDEEAGLEAFGRAVAAKGRRAPANAWGQFARLYLAASPPRSQEALNALRAAPVGTLDREALEMRLRLEIELSPVESIDGPEVRAARERVDAAERAAGAASLARARGMLLDDDRWGALRAAREATELLPEDAEAWLARAWFALRLGEADEGARALRHAVERADDPDAQWRKGRAWLRIFGVDPNRIDEEDAPEEAK